MSADVCCGTNDCLWTTRLRDHLELELTAYFPYPGSVYEINRTEEKSETGPNGEHRTAQGTDYEATVKAFKGADAVIHVAATPSPGKLPDRSSAAALNSRVEGSD
jgi:nucleoside-diphosphate-sugar epimerase